MSDRLLVATRKGLFHLSRLGDRKWEIDRTSFWSDNVSMVMRDRRDNAIYAALEHGHFGAKLHRSDNDGETWEELTPPAYPEGEMLEPSEMDLIKEPKPCTLELIWSLTPGGDDQPGLMWCGTIPGGLFKSINRGESWELVRSLWDEPKRKKWFGGGRDRPGIHSILRNPNDADHLIVGVSCGGVWVTRDGGESWKIKADGMRADFMPPERQYEPDIQDPHLVAMCNASPNHLWVQHHNGIFRSTDGSESWTEVTDVKPSNFGFAVAAHPTDPDTAWFVPAQKDEHRIPVEGKVVVTRTRDGAKSFEQLTDGLPQAHAYDLTFRHALDVDASGTRLAFGSTTGSLWISENEGDSWTTVSNHLPPIYAICFA